MTEKQALQNFKLAVRARLNREGQNDPLVVVELFLKVVNALPDSRGISTRQILDLTALVDNGAPWDQIITPRLGERRKGDA